MRSSSITGRVARLRQLEALLHHAHDGRQIRPRIEQPHRRFHRIGIGALLDHARALAVVLAEDDQRAADHARRGEVRQRVGRHIGADDRLPGHGAAQRIVDRGAQHGGGRGLVGAGLDMHAEIGEQVLGLDHDVEQMRDRRALIAADIAHARLQQRLGDRQDAFAAEGLAGAELERLDFLLERAFHGGGSRYVSPQGGQRRALSSHRGGPNRARAVPTIDSLPDDLPTPTVPLSVPSGENR